MRRSIGVLMILAMVFVACGSPSEDSSPARSGTGGGSDGNIGSDTPVSSTPDPGGDAPLPGGRAQRVRPRPGMADLHKVAWEKARQTSSGRSLRVTYWSGVEPCNVLDHAEVSYEDKKIVVTIYEGHDPTGDDVACIEIALLKAVQVQLDEPVDGRQIVDGSK